MGKRIHFIQVEPSKFRNQLKNIEVFNTFYNSISLNKGQYCKLSNGILLYYIEQRFHFRLLVHLDTFISSLKN